MKKFFREIKRLVSQFFETEYWYRRYIPEYWFNDETNKYEKIKIPYIGYNPLMETWDGEGSILRIMIRKIEHMICVLRKYGNEKDWYIDSFRFKKGNKSDKEWAIKKCFESYKKKEQYGTVTKFGDTTRIFVINDEVSKDVSDSGLRHYYVETEDFEKFRIVHYDDQEIPQDQIKKKDKLYKVEMEDGEFKSQVAAQYSHEPYSICHGSDLNWTRVEQFFKTTFNINVNERLIDLHQTFDVTPEDLKSLSVEVKSYVRGNRQKIKDLLELRRLLKKYLSFDDLSDKYQIENIEGFKEDCTPEEKSALYEKAHKLFLRDRKDVLDKVSILISQKGFTWWD